LFVQLILYAKAQGERAKVLGDCQQGLRGVWWI